jgi:hypothetical protein
MDLANYITDDGSLCIPKESWKALCKRHELDEITDAFVDLTAFWKQPVVPCGESFAINAFESLRSMTAHSIIRQDSGLFRHGPAFSGMCIAGNIKIGKHSATYFNDKNRWRASYRSNLSPFDGWTTRDVVYRTVRSLAKKQVEITEFNYKHDLFNYAPLVSHFSPAVAKALYTIFGGGHVLDMCSGWGDRLSGALACESVLSYTGVDTNTALKDSYADQVSRLGASKKCSFYFEDAGCCSFESMAPAGGFDIAFTSPPYFNLERYPLMPAHYVFRDWVSCFLQPMLNSAMSSLKSGGHLALNVGNFKGSAAADHIDIAGACSLFMRDQFGLRISATIGMIIPPRFPTKTPSPQQTLEPILVWRKP